MMERPLGDRQGAFCATSHGWSPLLRCEGAVEPREYAEYRTLWDDGRRTDDRGAAAGVMWPYATNLGRRVRMLVTGPVLQGQ